MLNYKITLPEKAYSSREKIKMSITATDNKGNPVESDFSVSVAKAVTLMIKVLTGINSGSCLPWQQLIVINYQRILIIGSYFIIPRIPLLTNPENQ